MLFLPLLGTLGILDMHMTTQCHLQAGNHLEGLPLPPEIIATILHPLLFLALAIMMITEGRHLS